MLMKRSGLVVAVVVGAGLLAAAQGPRRVALGDWPEARGPNRDGTSKETGLVEKWAFKDDLDSQDVRRPGAVRRSRNG